MNKSKPPIFWISEILFLALALFCVLQILELKKPKGRLNRASGKITMFTHQYLDLDFHNSGLLRFIKLDTGPEIFELKVTDKTGESFSPAFEQADSLKQGDYITIYYATVLYSSDNRTTGSVCFVDKGGHLIYIESQSGIHILAGLAMFCAVCMGLVFVLKNEGFII